MMAGRRVRYVMVLAILFGVFLWVDSYLAAFALLMALVIPWISLAISLPAMLSCRVRVEGIQSRCVRGQENQWRITVYNTAQMPLRGVKVHLRLRQMMTEQTQQRTVRYGRMAAAMEDRMPMDTSSCGVWEATVLWMRVYDALGLLSIRRRLPMVSQVVVMPQSIAAESLPEIGQKPEQSYAMRPRRGGGMGEEYELREYRPGDPVRMIHWKLSSKRDELIFREVMERPETVLVLTFDHLGPQEHLDGILDRLYALSNELLTRQQHHEIRWLHPKNGQHFRFLLGGEDDLHRCFGELLSQPAPLEGYRFPEGRRQEAGFVFYHLKPAEEEKP